MLHVESRESLKGRKGKRFISLPSVKFKTFGKEPFAECQRNDARQSALYRVSAPDTRQRSNGSGWSLTEGGWCRVLFFCQVFFWRHSAKSCFCLVSNPRHSTKSFFAKCFVFAECPSVGTRQRGCLPSARQVALGKPPDTRYISSFW
jgi:hypothetical protein